MPRTPRAPSDRPHRRTWGIVFGGGFPRSEDTEIRRAGQRAIFFVQRELEETARAVNAANVLYDRGTVDGVAYWPGPEPLWGAVGTSREDQLGRYDAVIHHRDRAGQKERVVSQNSIELNAP